MSHSRATKWVLWGLKITKDFSWAHRIEHITKRLLVVVYGTLRNLVAATKLLSLNGPY